MDAGDLEALAVETYERNGFAVDEAASPIELARRVLNEPDPIEWVDWLVSGNGALYRVNGRRRIALRKGLPIEYALFVVGHEVAHVVLEDAGYAEDRLEDSCDYLSATLLAPAPAVLRLHNHFGLDLNAIASETCSTETWAALRIGEVCRLPLVAIQPKKARFRGPPEQLDLFPRDLEELRVMARSQLTPGIKKVPILDAQGRVALVRAR